MKFKKMASSSDLRNIKGLSLIYGIVTLSMIVKV